MTDNIISCKLRSNIRDNFNTAITIGCWNVS